MNLKQIKKKSIDVADIMKTMGHPGRLLILCSLLDSKKTVTEIEEICEMSQSQTSQYLKRLEAAGLIDSEKDGKFHLYSIKDQRIRELMSKLQELYC